MSNEHITRMGFAAAEAVPAFAEISVRDGGAAMRAALLALADEIREHGLPIEVLVAFKKRPGGAITDAFADALEAIAKEGRDDD